MKRRAKMAFDPVAEAVQGNEIERLRQLIERRVSLDHQAADGRTPLMIGVLGANIEAVRLLIQAGADPNLKDRDGYTALHFAAQDYQIDAAKLLLSAAVEIDSRDAYGNSPLWRAVFNSFGRGEMISMLLSAGASRDLENDSGVSPFGLAQTIGNYDAKQFFK
jgi:ankyrin repeat protein